MSAWTFVLISVVLAVFISGTFTILIGNFIFNVFNQKMGEYSDVILEAFHELVAKIRK